MKLPYFYIGLAMVLVLNLGAMVGYRLGAHMAAEHFYDTCQGGEVFFERPDGKVLPAIGCAEIARHVR